MEKPILYRGQWPRNVNKTAKYAVRNIEGRLRVTVICDLEDGLRFLAVESGDIGIADQVNKVKRAITGQDGGQFYINEYQHLIVPVTESSSSYYYEAGKVNTDFIFEFEGKRLTTKPIDLNGTPLSPGDLWVGPRPGIPYVLSAGGNDIYYETPALTNEDPPKVRAGVTQRVNLSKKLQDKKVVARTVDAIYKIRGSQGGRFYVNEHKAIFTPVDKGDGNGLDYIYCGQVDTLAWFPEPPLASA